MGVWRSVDLAAVSRPVVTIARIGFSVAAASGICLLATKATDYVGNPFLYIKFPAIGLALINAAMLNSSEAWRQRYARELSAQEQSKLAWMGGISLLCWLIAISAGRMIGYW
jgi:hypothetical protein